MKSGGYLVSDMVSFANPPEWLTLKRLITLNVGKDVELSYFADGSVQ